MSQSMRVSAAHNIAIVVDSEAAESGVRQRFQKLSTSVQQLTGRSLNLVFAKIDGEIEHAVDIKPEYQTHLVDSITREHIETGSVDWVILSHAVESTSQPRQLLREATRVLSEGGRLSIFAFSPLHYLERALWRKLTKSRPSVRAELSRWRLQDWLKVLNYEITTASGFIAPLRCLSTKFRQQQLEREHVSTSSWTGMVYQVEALKRDLPVTPVRLDLKTKSKIPMRLVSSTQGNSHKTPARAELQLVRVRTQTPDKKN